MDQGLPLNPRGKNATYVFRFSASNERIRLTQEQLNRIPYLSTLVANKKKFLVNRNKKDEYVLNPPIYYICFVAILLFIKLKQLYIWFTELPEDGNLLDTLQLLDFLVVQSFAPPRLKTKRHLVLSNPINEEQRIVYHPANLSEARDIAAQFLLALSQNQYQLLNKETADEIFSLILIIISNTDVFCSRFRQHTLTITKECCFKFFSGKQRSLLLTTHVKMENQEKLNSLKYLYDDNNSFSNYSIGAFAWKSVSSVEEENKPDLSATDRWRTHLLSIYSYFQWEDRWPEYLLPFDSYFRTRFEILEENEELMKKEKALFVRCRRSNSLPKRSYIDKFKHRPGPKAQKYR